MAIKTQNRGAEREASAREIQEELAFLRQKCNSLSFRGDYVECAKIIEENIRLFYFKERWPENFFTVLRLHQRCYPSLGKDQPYEEYLSALLKKNSIPYIFARLLRGSDSSIVWSSEHFRDLAIVSQEREDNESALAYVDIAIKLDPGSSNAYLVKGWVLDDMGNADDASSMYRHALELAPANFHALNGLAKSYLKTDPAKALELVEQALESSPSEAKYHALKASALRRLGDNARAVESLDAAMKNDPYNEEYPYIRGEIYRDEGNQVKAIAQYRLAIALNEKHVPSLKRLVEFGREKQPDLALIYINTVCTLEPDNLEVSLIRAELQRRTGELDASVKQYKQILEKQPDNAEALGGIGAIYLIKGDFSRALRYLEDAVRLAPKETVYHLDKARVHARLGEQDAAVEEFKATLALDKKNPRAWAELGELYSESKPREALDCFDKALAAAPENAYYHASKGELLLKTGGDAAKTIESFSLACKFDPGNPRLHAQLGRLLEDAENFASAVERYKTAVGLDSADHECFFRLARIELDTHPDMALLYINSAIRLSSGRGDYFYLKARVFIALGHDEEALTQLKASVSTDGKNPEAMGEMAELSADGSPRLALSYINRALETDPENTGYLCLRAQLLYRLDDRAGAKAQYEKLLASDPLTHEALFGMALILAGQGEKSALGYFDKAIAIAPSIAEYHAEKAAYLSGFPECYEQAVEEYSSAITLNNRMWQVLLDKARLLDRHGNTGEAMRDYRRVLLLRPGAIEATARMGVLLAVPAPQNALAYLDNAVFLEPANPTHFIWRGMALLGLGNTDAGESELQTALSLGGDTGEMNHTIASIIGERFPESALPFCYSAISQEPDNASFHLILGRMHLALGSFDTAVMAFEKALAIDPGCHDARELTARVALLRESPYCLERVEAALEGCPDCPRCLYIKALALEKLEGKASDALACVARAVELEPKNLEYHEKYASLLTKTRSFIKMAVERTRIMKLRKELDARIDLQEPPVFERVGSL